MPRSIAVRLPAVKKLAKFIFFIRIKAKVLRYEEVLILISASNSYVNFTCCLSGRNLRPISL